MLVTIEDAPVLVVSFAAIASLLTLFSPLGLESRLHERHGRSMALVYVRQDPCTVHAVPEVDVLHLRARSLDEYEQLGAIRIAPFRRHPTLGMRASARSGHGRPPVIIPTAAANS
jgi:hypothetical protein